MSELKVRKDIIYTIIITAVITFLISYAIFSYLPQASRNSQINDYKKALYDSLLCQYSCPLTLQNSSQGMTSLPDQTCVQSCTDDLRAYQQQGETISNAELANDNLVKDIEALVTSCRNTSIDQTQELPQLDSEKFFECVSTGLSSLKNQYSYLR